MYVFFRFFPVFFFLLDYIIYSIYFFFNVQFVVLEKSAKNKTADIFVFITVQVTLWIKCPTFTSLHSSGDIKKSGAIFGEKKKKFTGGVCGLFSFLSFFK